MNTITTTAQLQRCLVAVQLDGSKAQRSTAWRMRGRGPVGQWQNIFLACKRSQIQSAASPVKKNQAADDVKVFNLRP